MIKRAINWVFSGLIALAVGWSPLSGSTQELDFFDLFNMSERIDGSYYTMIDQADGSVLQGWRTTWKTASMCWSSINSEKSNLLQPRIAASGLARCGKTPPP